MLTVYVSNAFVHISEMSIAIAMQCSVLMPLICRYSSSGKYCHVYICCINDEMGKCVGAHTVIYIHVNCFLKSMDLECVYSASHVGPYL